MKTREQRRHVTTQARMRTNAGWSDVTIRDVSSRGLGLRSARAPRRGDYVELCRHHHKLVARVMWTDGDRFGVLLSDSIVVDDLLSSRPALRGGSTDRRRQARAAGALRPGPNPRVAIVNVAQKSQNASRAMNFIAVAAIACIGAGFAAALAGSVLTKAMDGVSLGLNARPLQASVD